MPSSDPARAVAAPQPPKYQWILDIIHWLGKALGFLYLIRVPLATLLVLAGIGPFANGLGQPLLANLFDQGTSYWGVCVVCFFGFVVSAICIACINVVLYSGDRFPNSHLAQRHIGLTFVLGALPSFVFAGYIWHGTTQLSAWQLFWPTLLGLAFAFAAGWIAKFVQIAFWEPTVINKNPPDMILPLLPISREWKAYQWLYNLQLFVGFNTFLQPVWRFLREVAGPGYFEKDSSDPPKLYVASKHAYLAGLFVVSFALWVGFGSIKQRVLEGKPDIWILSELPALAWLLILLMVACLVLGAIAFFFDRFRIPMVGIIMFLALVTNQFPQSDHFFAVQKSTSSFEAQFLRPEAYLSKRSQQRKRFILVSTAGGGIQAAAWTAKVLSGFDNTPNFRDSVLLISSVSGGTIGAIAYARTFDQTHRSQSFDPTAASEAGALDAAAWGWFVPDIWRIVFPWLRDPMIDRGWGMERAWTKIMQLRAQDGHETTLADWATESTGGMPALIMNSSLVEAGNPVIFSNMRFADKPKDEGPTAGIFNFHTASGGEAPYTYDISVATAGRLSSSFPYVAPAARSNLHPDQAAYHFVDGGYYDNYGITTLFAWLEKALPACKDCKFLLLRITHFPPSSTPATSKHGWFFQTYAPIQAQYDSREAGQLTGDNNQVRLEATVHAQLTGAAVQFAPTNDCADPPLSWQLNAAQKNCIDSTWSSSNLSKAKQCVQKFLAGEDQSSGCDNLAQAGLAEEAQHAVDRKK